MKIAHVNQDPGIAPHRAKGAAVHLRVMREAFRQLGSDVSAIDDPDPDNVRRKLEELHAEQVLDLVYERYSCAGLAASRFACLRGIPHVLEVNAPLGREAARYRGGSTSDGDAADEFELFSQASLVVAVSEEVARFSMSQGASRDRILVAPNGVDPRRFQPLPAGAKRPAELGPEGRFVIGFHGRLRPWHGFKTLVDATRRLLEEGHDVQLAAIGTGPFEEELEGVIPAQRRTLVPWVPYDEVGRWVAGFDALALTYADDPGFYFSPLKLLEAMACGVTVVVPDLGNLAELVQHGQAGLVYAPGEFEALLTHLRALIADPHERRVIGQRGVLVARGHSWTNIARRILDQACVGAQ